MFSNKKNRAAMLELRQTILNGEFPVDETVGENKVTAVVLDASTKRGVYSLIVVSDGSCSLYFERGGGIIGAGQHKNVQYVCDVLLSKANDFVKTPASQLDYALPKNNDFVIHIVTKNGVCEFFGENDLSLKQENSNELFRQCDNVITQIRLIDSNKNQPFSDDEILINFIRENNFDAFCNALKDLGNRNAIEEEKSALMIATYKGNKDIVTELIRKGADLSFADSTGLNSLMVACYIGKPHLIESLADISTLGSKDEHGQTPLMFACNGGAFDCVKLLIDMKVDINATDNEDSTALMFAAQHGHNSIVSYLLENGADKNLVGKHGLEAVDFASRNNHLSTAGLLL